jgi:hypothetical protein
MIEDTIKRVVGFARAIGRADSWQNMFSGMGTGADRTTAGVYSVSVRITDPELSALYHTSDTAATIVDTVPQAMLRQGFGVTCPDVDAATKVTDRAKALDVLNHVREGLIWGRLFGGAVLLIGADDNQDPRLPLDEAGIRSLSFLQVYDRRYAQPDTYYEDPKAPKFGRPKTFRLTNLRSGSVAYVHESRLIVFRGAHTGAKERQENLDWDYSTLQRPYEALRQFDAVYKAAEIMMTDASQAVFKMTGLLQMIAGGQLDVLNTRANFLDMTRSVSRAVLLDADGEDFTKIATSFAGVGDMLDRTANRLSAASKIPVPILMGQAPAGLNATGDSTIRIFYDGIESERTETVEPKLFRLVRLISIAERLGDRRFGIKFKSLWLETPKEKADREKVEADTAAVWITNEVLDPDTVAIAHFGSDEAQPYRVDPAERRPVPTLETKKPDQVLNGAQIQAAESIVSQVVAGQMPRDSAIGQLQIMFNLTIPQAESILGSAGKGFTPTNAPPTV